MCKKRAFMTDSRGIWTHFASVSVLPLRRIRFEVFVVLKNVAVFLRLQHSLQMKRANSELELRQQVQKKGSKS